MEETEFMILYGFSLFLFIIEFICCTIAAFILKFDFPIEELQALKKIAKKQSIITGIIFVVFPLFLLPLKFILQGRDLLFNLILIFFSIAFSSLLLSRIIRYISIKKEIRKRTKG
jgi:hypothetical protein